MTTTTGALAEFILARIAEDEEAALGAAGWDPSGRQRASGLWERWGVNSVHHDHGRPVVYGDGSSPSDSEVEHIARHDPARVLAECEAKRRIVRCTEEQPAVMAEVIAHMAEAYADHEDYREDWRP